MKRTPRIKPALLIASAAAATVLVGTIGGATMALWHDDESFTSQIQTGKVAFAVGAPGATLAKSATASGQTLDFTFGKAEAATLLDSKAVAIPIQVNSLSQGNKGMRYTATPPTFAENSLFKCGQNRTGPRGLRRGVHRGAQPESPSSKPCSYYTRTPVSSDLFGRQRLRLPSSGA